MRALWKFLKFSLVVVVVMVVLLFVLGDGIPWVLRSIALKGDGLVATTTRISPKLAMWVNGQVFALRMDRSLFPNGFTQTPATEKVAGTLDTLAKFSPGVTEDLLAIFTNRHTVLLIAGVVLLILGISLLRRHGVGGIFNGISARVGTPLGLATTLLGVLLIAMVVWAIFIGWEAVMLAIQPIIPLAVVILLGITFWEVIKKVITQMALGGFIIIMLLMLYSVLDPSMVSKPWVQRSPILSTITSIGASFMAGQSKETVIAVTGLAAIIAVILLIITLQRRGERVTS